MVVVEVDALESRELVDVAELVRPNETELGDDEVAAGRADDVDAVGTAKTVVKKQLSSRADFMTTKGRWANEKLNEMKRL